MGTYMGVHEAAQFLGVSTSTIKRMSNDNLLPCIRTPGGHRRFDPGSLERAAHEHLGGSVQPMRPQTTQSDIEELLDLLMHGDSDLAWRKLDFNVSRTSDVLRRLDQGLAPALWRMSDICQQERLGIYRERLATSTAHRLLDRLSNQLDYLTGNRNEYPVTVVGTMAGNFDHLSTQFVATSLKLLPSHTINLGCNLPVSTMVRAAQDLGAHRVCVSHTHVENISSAIEWHQELRASLPAKTRVIIGGGGLSPTARRQLSFDAYYETLTDAVAAEAAIASSL